MTEREIDELIRDPKIKMAAAHARPMGVSSFAGADRTEKAVANWVAVLTRVYLKAQGAVSNPLVEKVWAFAGGTVDVDMRVGVQGTYKKFKVTAELSGPTSLVLRIHSWNKFGRPEPPWVRYGAYRGGNLAEGIETLPLR